MPNTTSNSVNHLLSRLKKDDKPSLITLQCNRGGNDFLMEHVLKRLKKEFASSIYFIEISEPQSKQIKEELKFSKTPALVFVADGEIRLLFEGVLPYQYLAGAIAEQCNL